MRLISIVQNFNTISQRKIKSVNKDSIIILFPFNEYLQFTYISHLHKKIVFKKPCNLNNVKLDHAKSINFEAYFLFILYHRLFFWVSPKKD